MLQEWADRLEVARLRLHFARVRLYLRTRDSAPELRSQRQQVIDELGRYAERGVFPRNYTHQGTRPCFIDQEGQQCAVAHLLIQTGFSAEAQQIALHANTAYVADMPFPELDLWARDHGLTREELAVVQPGYPITTKDILPFIGGILALLGLGGIRFFILLLTITLTSSCLTILDWRKRRTRRIKTIFPLMTGVCLGLFIVPISIVVGLFFLLIIQYGWQA